MSPYVVKQNILLTSTVAVIVLGVFLVTSSQNTYAQMQPNQKPSDFKRQLRKSRTRLAQRIRLNQHLVLHQS